MLNVYARDQRSDWLLCVSRCVVHAVLQLQVSGSILRLLEVLNVC